MPKELEIEERDEETPLEGVSKPKGGVCPIPKPGGIVGEILGFQSGESSRSKGGKGEKPP